MRVLKLSVLWDSKAAESGMAGLAATSDTTAAKIGKSGEEAGAKFSAGIQAGTSRAAGGLEKLGGTLGQWGIPFSNRIEKIGKDLGNIETRGKGVGEALSAVGGVVTLALIGAGAEAVKISDQFEIAQAGLQTSIKNAGGTWGQYKGQVDAAYASAAKLGFENQDVATGLQTLVTATQSPTKALSDLSTVENIARARHESLTDASGQLAKILGGNTRLLQQWGINLDIGSGKLHSIQSAEESLQKAQLAQTHVQDEVNDGSIKGVNASYDLANAKLSVRNAELNLQQSQKAIPDILDAINQRTQGMADAYGKTLPGELQTARAEIHNIGTELGGVLVPDIDKLLGLGGDVLGFFDHSAAGAVVLGAAIGGPLAAAVAVFTYNRVVNLLTGLQKMGQGFVSLATTVLDKTGIIDVAAREQAEISTQTARVIAASQQTQVAAWETSAASIDAIMSEQETMYRQFGISTSESIEDAASAFTGLQVQAGQSAASVDASLAEMSAAAKLSAAGIDTSLGDIGAGAEIAASKIAILGAGIAGLAVEAAVPIIITYEILKHTGYVQNLGSGDVSPQAASKEIKAQIAGVAGSSSTLAGEQGNLSDIDKQIKNLNAEFARTGIADRIGSRGQIIAPANGVDAVLAAEKQAAKDAANADKIPNLGSLPNIGGGTGATGPTAAQKALATLQANATKFLATLADEADPANNTSLSSLQSKLHTATDKASALAATTLENKLKAAGQTGLADKIASAFAAVGTDLQTRIKQAATDAANLKLQKSGNKSLAGLEGDSTSTNVTQLQKSLDPTNKAAMDRLVVKLDDTHKKSLQNLAVNLLMSWDKAETNLTGLLAKATQVALTDQTQNAADALNAQTTADQDASSSEVSIIQAMSTKVVNGIQAAATAISDSARVSSDITTGQTTGISDQTQAMNDATAATVQAIQDQTAIQVDQLGETGLYGLQLTAQQAKVALDQQTMIDHQNEAAGTAHLDAVTSSENQIVATDQLRLDQATASIDSQIARDQAALDSQTIQDLTQIGQDQAHADAVGIQNTIALGNAQATLDQDTAFGISTDSAQANLNAINATNAFNQANADASLNTEKDNAAQIEAALTATLDQDQANGTLTVAQLQAILTNDQAASAQQIALATQSLASLTDTSNVNEAKLQSVVDILTAQANTQFSGGGTVYNFYGVPLDNAAAISNEVDWTTRTATPAPVGT